MRSEKTVASRANSRHGAELARLGAYGREVERRNARWIVVSDMGEYLCSFSQSWAFRHISFTVRPLGSVDRTALMASVAASILAVRLATRGRNCSAGMRTFDFSASAEVLKIRSTSAILTSIKDTTRSIQPFTSLATERSNLGSEIIGELAQAGDCREGRDRPQSISSGDMRASFSRPSQIPAGNLRR